MKIQCEIFGTEWWQVFAECWNNATFRQELSGFGPATFIVSGEDGTITATTLIWDSGGVVQLLGQMHSDLIFSATEKNWISFLQGSFTATDGLLDGHLKFVGQLGKIIPYSVAFNKIPVVAQVMNLKRQNGQ